MSQSKFRVSRFSKTKGSVLIGTYDTITESQAAMGLHFLSSPKRGTFFYLIEEVEFQEIGGVMMVVSTVGSSKYRRKYSKEELYQIHQQEFG